ncbi:hypothetical protein [Streptomyces aurantiacus]|uniref:hypothetical protein n=1 Tax=Streptomyces aurantiacus TaxID=47760 RepID=UPI000A8066BD|nr:hypothetical protein [Streptomyces aurantiacus]
MRTVRYDFDFVRAQGRRLGRDLCARLAGLCLVSGLMAPDPSLFAPFRDWPHSDWEAR